MDRALRQLIDRQEITDLIHDYCIHIDRYETEKVGALFTEDCITDYGEAFGREVVGRRRVERGSGYTLAAWKATSHHVSNIRLWFEDDDTPTFQIWAQYHDRFVRTAEGWRFSERRVRAAGQEGANNDFPGIGRRTPDPALVEKVRSRAGE
jgi:hypothetical protein